MNEDTLISTPLGPVALSIEDNQIQSLDFLSDDIAGEKADGAIARSALQQLAAYFHGDSQGFDLPIEAIGTDYQQRVWQALLNIPYGETVTYGDLAEQLNSGPRAVGGACRSNPVPILIPCHRVVAKHGSGGYMGNQAAGIAIKNWLIQHERGHQFS